MQSYRSKIKFGRSALHSASKSGHNAVILELLVKKADINEYDSDKDLGRTPLLYAVLFKRPKTVQLLLDQGADVNLPTKGLRRPNRTALHCAIELDQQEIFEIIFKFKPNLDARDDHDETPLRLAIERRRINYIEQLLAAGADVESKIRLQTALVYAALVLNNLQIAQILIDNKADLEIPSENGGTMLHLAVYHDRIDTIQFLLNNGININHQDASGSTPLILCARTGSAVSMKELVTYNPSVNLQDKFGTTALHYSVSAYDESEEKTSILLKYGAEPLIINKEGLSSLGLAKRQVSEKILELLAKALEDAGRMIEDPRWSGMRIFLWPELLRDGYEVQSKNGLPFIFSLRRGQLTETRGMVPPWLPPRKRVLPTRSAEVKTE